MTPLAEALASLPRGPRSELAGLAALATHPGLNLVTTCVLDVTPERTSLDPNRRWLLRSLAPSDRPVASIFVGTESAASETPREIILPLAELLVGIPKSRLEASFPADETLVAGWERLADLYLQQHKSPLPDGDAARLALLISRLHELCPAADLVAQELPAGSKFGHFVSRDLRSGVPGVLGHVSDQAGSLVRPAGRDRPIADLGLSPDVVNFVDEMSACAERALRCPVRLSMLFGESAPALIRLLPETRSAHAGLRLLAELVTSGGLPRESALAEASVSGLTMTLAVLPTPETRVQCRGVAAGGGVAQGLAALSPRQAEDLAAHGHTPILIAHELEAEDAPAARAAAGVVSVRGGITGEAAIMCRALGKPCVAAAGSLTLDGEQAKDRAGNAVRFGDRIAIDGASGVVLSGSAHIRLADTRPEVLAALEWADALRPPRLLASVLSAVDVVAAHELGADGFGLVATEALMAQVAGADQPAVELESRLAELVAAARQADKPLWLRTPRADHVLSERCGALGSGEQAVALFQRTVAGLGVGSIREVVDAGSQGLSALVLTPGNLLDVGQTLPSHCLFWDNGTQLERIADAVMASDTSFWLVSLPRLPEKRLRLGQAALHHKSTT